MNIQNITPIRFSSAQDEIISNNLSNMFSSNASSAVEPVVYDNFTPPKPQVPQKQKKSAFEGFLNFIGNMKKVFVNITDWTAGALKGLGLGGLLGTMTVGGMLVGNKILNVTKRKAAPKPANKPLYIASGVGIGMLAFLKTLYDTKLMVNKKSHNIDVEYVSTPMITK